MNDREDRLSSSPIWSMLMGVVFFLAVFGVRVLDPTYVAWLFENDHAQHYSGWLFFRYEPWQFPLGKLSLFGVPDGSSVVYTDSIPLFALVFKILRAFLPEPFQYFGLWILVCYVLQGYFGWRLSGWVSERVVDRLLISAFFIISPILLFRGTIHHSLMGHWLLLWGFLLCLEDTSSSTRNTPVRVNWKGWSCLLVISSMVHLYLLAAVSVLYLFVRGGEIFSSAHARREAVLRSCLPFLFVLPVMWVEGFFVVPASNWRLGDPNDYLHFSMNLLAPFNPLYWPAQPAETDGVHSLIFCPVSCAHSLQTIEGFNYLGAGVLLLLASVCIGVLVNVVRGEGFGRARDLLFRKKWLVLAIFFLAFFSITTRFTWGPSQAFEVPIPRWLLEQLTAFRASGRFFWTPAYALLLFVLWYLRGMLVGKRYLFTVLLAASLAVQIVDLSSFFRWTNRHVGRAVYYNNPFDTPEWLELYRGKKNITFYPVIGNNRYLEFSLVAASRGLGITSAYKARYDERARLRLEEEIKGAWETGNLRNGDLYITVDKTLYDELVACHSPLVESRVIQDYYVAWRKD